ncbi:SWIM zinc finger domain protein [Myxococcus hansupus]|uniref:SWIM zinc finger domain protein n=1 Tax=Pseudomyxococcus hansupus TaxID=1297742 RepID=A0A0H4X9R1_9BACT|nr:hypothetical protein [Myxococcus hansupus]AKQ64612.1 SWIM zinc finger domain protein [Myxococcus hansupus]
MTALGFLYATPSVFESTRERARLDLSADQHRPVRFHARVARDVLSLRLALQALGGLIWHSDEWNLGSSAGLLDPLITVHPDRVFFEAFSQDQSSYGLVIVDRDIFVPEGDVRCGTTNVDFTAWLWAALGEMRSSRETHLRIGPEGFDVRTGGAGGRFEQKVEVPEAWVRGLLQLQGAMAMPGTRLSVRPVDLLAAVRFLSHTKARMSPRALRYEFEPGQDARLMLEPWEHPIPLRGAAHGYTEPRTIRTWGRRRLRLLEPLLPYAERVDIYLKGRALPHFYVAHLPGGVRFLLGLSGWTENRWTHTSGLDLLLEPTRDAALAERVLAVLRERFHASTEDVATALGVDVAQAAGALAAQCAAGRVLFDVEARRWRHRELFATPVDLDRMYPPDPRREDAERLEAAGAVEITSAAPRETRKVRRLPTPEGSITREIVLRDWVVHGRAGDQSDIELVLNDEDRLLFGRCGCEAFREHLLNRGPCTHMLALLRRARVQRRELASSQPAPEDARAAPRASREAALDPEGADDDNG